MNSLKYGVLSLIILSFLLSCGKTIPFDKEIWESDTSIETANDKLTPRQKMIDSVLEQIEGLSRQEIIMMLGEETETDKFSYYDEELIYVLGPERSFFSIDYEWLLLSFDEDDRLIQSELITD
ncbi:MAG: hypothetical protein JEY99_04475 [Spirochaetales bacterium]|nr:hypothetical protein [Spirochaetales bacterium]